MALRLWATGSSLVELGVDNLSDTRRSDKSALFTYAEPPRIWRLALRTRW